MPSSWIRDTDRGWIVFDDEPPQSQLGKSIATRLECPLLPDTGATMGTNAGPKGRNVSTGSEESISSWNMVDQVGVPAPLPPPPARRRISSPAPQGAAPSLKNASPAKLGGNPGTSAALPANEPNPVGRPRAPVRARIWEPSKGGGSRPSAVPTCSWYCWSCWLQRDRSASSAALSRLSPVFQRARVMRWDQS